MRYIRDIWCPLLAVLCRSFSSVRACTCSKEKRTRVNEREREIDLHPLAPSRFLIQPPLPPQSLPSREVERPFEICRWPKNAPEEECALAWPRIQDSYLLTESLRKGGVIERHYYFVRTSSAATARLWTMYASGSLGIYLRQHFFFSQLFSCSPSPSFSLFFSFIHYNFKIYIRLLCVQVFKKLVILSARIGFFLWKNKFTYSFFKSLHYGGNFNFRKIV